MDKISFEGVQYIPDFDLNSSYEEIDEFDKELSNEEELLLQDILTLEQQANVGNHFMSDLLSAVEKGSLDYIDSMTDTNDTLVSMKRSGNVSKWDDVDIKPINTSPYKDDSDTSQTRKMSDANKSAFLNISDVDTSGMSASGKQLFKKYEEAYSQRTKSLSQLSKEGNTINRSDKNTNFETLSGLRGYRIGPVVPMPTAKQAKEGYDQYLANNGGTGKTASSWLYDENMKQFDTELAKQLGFNTPKEAEKWRKENKLTVHEGPDGMFMVPSDVHASARHDGYRSMMSKYMKGEISEAEMKTYIREEKVAYVKHEAKERGTRMIKGIGMSAIKDVLKCAIVVITKETISEFRKTTEDKFVTRMMRIFKQSWAHVWEKCKQILSGLWKNIKSSFLSELLTALNDFFFKTFKNVFKVIRQMWSSIKSAFKIICSSNYSKEEKAFEVMKVLTSGIVGVIGFSLNEILEKGLLSIGLPLPFASFISECLSGLFSGIMSAVVLMLFDNLKKHLKAKSAELQLLQLKSRKLCLEIGHQTLESLKFYKHLDEDIMLALSPFTSVRLNGSIRLCSDLGTDAPCKNIQDVDNIIAGYNKNL